MRILSPLEDPRYIYLQQPENGNVEAFLTRHHMKICVGRSYYLYFPQLKSEVDPNQDAGTWYGLTSKLVLRDVRDHSKRSVLVPFGEMRQKRHKGHVLIEIASMGEFGRYFINRTLGRMDCAAEPRLIYTKALLHAATSFILPDPLTNHTGTEEALRWLEAGICQPWAPLSQNLARILKKIADLSPQRTYYPAHLAEMKVDSWNPALTPTIQHEALRPLALAILQRSRNLQTLSSVAPNELAQEEPLLQSHHSHLDSRALRRRLVYERPLGIETLEKQSSVLDRAYETRHRILDKCVRRRNTQEIVHLIRNRPSKIKTPQDLADYLSKSDTIGGRNSSIEDMALSDRLGIDLRKHWGSLVDLARESTNPFTLMFKLAPMAYNREADMELARTVAAFAIFDELKRIEAPDWPEYHNFKPGKEPDLNYLLEMVQPYRQPLPTTDVDVLENLASGKQRRKAQKEADAHRRRVDEDCKKFVTLLMEQWPCLQPRIPNPDKDLLLDVEQAYRAISLEWISLYQNRDFSNYLVEVQAVLNQRRAEDVFEPEQFIPVVEYIRERTRGGEVLSLIDLLRKPFKPLMSPKELAPSGTTPLTWQQVLGKHNRTSPHTRRHIPSPQKRYFTPSASRAGVMPKPNYESLNELQTIATRLCASGSRVRQRYGEDLAQSIRGFRYRVHENSNHGGRSVQTNGGAGDPFSEVDTQFRSIQTSFETPDASLTSPQIRWLKAGHLWPAITQCTLLGYLRSEESMKLLHQTMKSALVGYGILITKCQRELRIHSYLGYNSHRASEEEANIGHTNWSPEQHPYWLLLEIEADVLIRPDQVDVALATINPASGENSVLQMNMGQGAYQVDMSEQRETRYTNSIPKGKTSCIIPMVSAALADKRNLVRIIVPKPLLQQTAQILQSRLGIFLNKRLGYVPFSRKTQTDRDTITAFFKFHKDIQESRGVMICLPEHNLSFMLSGLQRLLDGKLADAERMIKIHRWFGTVCRDVLDESDYTLAVRTQLIYPSGTQMTVDGHPHRWKIVQALLRLVDLNLHDLAREYPHSIEVYRGHQRGFPFLYFLRRDVEDELINRLIADVLKRGSALLPMDDLATTERHAVEEFLRCTNVKKASVKVVRGLFRDKPSVRHAIYLLRGLLIGRILIMTLKKRWNVQYGLHPSRDPIAVPFYAKGVPSDQSEWGHPDVAILFTSLSFYYGGLSMPQLKQALEQVLNSDDPSIEYEKWINGCENYPGSLKSWNSINVEDEVQLHQVWNALRYKTAVIDYFMNTFVFPRHAKQFKVKLQSNGWDIPVFPPPSGQHENSSTRSKAKALSTGFSGTNDNRNMLPLNIKQEDLARLSHTNAEVMTYLLQPRSRECVMACDADGRRLTETEILELMSNLKIRVLIDAGAQILEMDNKTLAQKWLEIDTSADGALYFDNDRPLVITRSGAVTPLLASNFADDMAKCLVYLDEVSVAGG